jgi:hypothetical protein
MRYGSPKKWTPKTERVAGGFVLRWALIFLGLLACAHVHADGYVPTSWGIRIALKDGTVKTGYTDWYDGGGRSFNLEFDQAARNNPWILNYPRKSEIPKVECGGCNDQIFLLWADFHLWLGDRQEGSGMPENDLGLYREIFTITSPVSVTAFVKESIEDIPFEKIRSIEMDPSKSEKINLCIPALSAQERETLQHGKVLHSLEYEDCTYLFYDSTFGPVEWLKNNFHNCIDPGDNYFTAKIDGYSLGDVSVPGGRWKPPFVFTYHRGEFPDNPLFRTLADLMEKKAWQENHLRGDRKAYNQYSDENFPTVQANPLPGFIVTSLYCGDD